MLEQFSVAKSLELVKSGDVLIVDVRGPSEFAHGHPPGAISLPYSRKGLGERLKVLSDPQTPIILLAEDIDQAKAAALQLQEDHLSVAGITTGAMDDPSAPMEVLNEVSLSELAQAMENESTLILDVREPIEWEMGHVPGALLISLGQLRHNLDQVPREAHIAVICEAGIRSSSAASLLQAEGFPHIVNVTEGTGGYRNAGLPVEFYNGDGN